MLSDQYFVLFQSTTFNFGDASTYVLPLAKGTAFGLQSHEFRMVNPQSSNVVMDPGEYLTAPTVASQVPTPPLPPRTACTNCISKEGDPSEARTTTPGPLFRLSCGHVQCRSCMTERRFNRTDIVDYITCATCDRAAGFATVQGLDLSAQGLARMSSELVNIRDRQIFYPSSKHYAAQDFFMTSGGGSDVLKAVAQLALPNYLQPDMGAGTWGISSLLILQTLDRHFADMASKRLITPELLQAELEIVIQDIIYYRFVRQPDSPYHRLAPTFETGANETDSRRQRDLINALKGLYPGVGALANIWDGIVRWVVSVLAENWWEWFRMV
ncbi:hypothetical protein EK21DRAFT_94629 [Setomelanomma holmii]|uniref:RING-type domain-containing protein n=1 Tax=Setomelanomma holmii TaxID=210430 RepID=A0A9P4GY22_9PLEO|nr:hypothetical protein EK21DRAFT_94629 [Setomelanomma holmii]